MKILAVEFSTDQRSVAVFSEGRVLGAAMESATRETHAFSLITRALAEAHLEREAIECLAIGLGPGSYTGIRAAIALAQGWQLAVGQLKLLGISSAACLAAEAQALGWFGRVNVVIDAQRNELYVAGYEVSATECREVAPLKLASPGEVNAGEIIVGPEANRWFETGKVLYPNASMLGRLAMNRTDYVAGEKLEPIYLRETSFVKAPPPRVL